MQRKVTELERVIGQTLALISKAPPEKRYNVLFGEWNLKDTVAHLSGWCNHQLECFEAMEKRREPVWRKNIDDYNDQQVELRRKKGWDKVFNELTSLTSKLLRKYKGLSGMQWKYKFWKGRNFTPERHLDIELRHWSKGHLPEIERALHDH